MEYKDYYKILGVKRNVKQDGIKPAYRKLARKYHPDVSSEVDAEDKFKTLNEAYEVLKDPEKRVAYDQLGNNWENGQDFTSPPNWDPNFEFNGGGFTEQNPSAFSDFFEQLFARRQSTFGGSNQTVHHPAQDHHEKIMIDLADSINGTNRTLTLQKPYVNEQGHMLTKLHILNVKIPKGVTQGQQIRLKGQGAGTTGHSGDLYLEIQFNPHPLYRIKERDMEFDLSITPWEAALGATIRAPTPSGTIDIKIPPNSTTDQKLRIKGRGLPSPDKTKNGHLYALLKIRTPPATGQREEDCYRNMRDTMPFNPRKNLRASL